MALKSAAAGAAVMALMATQTLAGDYHPPRTAQGVPDLNGNWTNFSLTTLERPPGVDKLVLTEVEAKALEQRLSNDRANPNGDAIGNRPSEWWEAATLARMDGGVRTSWINAPADGHVPFSEEGRRRRAGRSQGTDNPENRGNSERCLTASWDAMSTPMMNSPYSANYQIVQTVHEVAILSEMNH